MKNLLVIAGFSRCGTTWLHNRLVLHPEIRPMIGQIKEVGYFEYSESAEWRERVLRANASRFPLLRRRVENLRLRSQQLDAEEARRIEGQIASIEDFTDNFGVDDAWYARMFGDLGNGWALDSTPSYSRLPASAFKRMASLADNLKVVLLLREPATRFRSLLQHAVMYSDNRLAKSSEQLVNQIKRKENPYLARLATIRSALRPEQIQIMFFEDMIRRRGFDGDALLASIGLSPTEEMESEDDEAPNPSVKLEIDRAVLEALADFGRRVTRDMEPVLGQLPPEWYEGPAGLLAKAGHASPDLFGMRIPKPDDRSREALDDKVEACLKANRTFEALRLVDEYIAAWPGDAGGFELRASLQTRASLFREARDSLRQAASLKGNRGGKPAGLAEVDEAQREINRGRELLGAGKHEEAIKLLRRLYRTHKVVAAQFHLARAEFERGRIPAARRALAVFVAERPDSEQGQRLRERLLSEAPASTASGECSDETSETNQIVR